MFQKIALFAVGIISVSARIRRAAAQPDPHFPVYCQDNGFCHVPGLPDSCTETAQCQTPWYPDSYCQTGGTCHLEPPPKCKTDADCQRPQIKTCATSAPASFPRSPPSNGDLCCSSPCDDSSECSPGMFCCPNHNECMDSSTGSTQGPACQAAQQDGCE